MNAWADSYATGNQGSVPRHDDWEAIGRRSESVEANSPALSPAEVSRLTGKVDVDHSAIPRTGSDVQAGNMGPTSVKGK